MDNRIQWIIVSNGFNYLIDNVMIHWIKESNG
jgi:hypothetical protein